MICKECSKKLKYHYYDIAGREFCKWCALTFMADISDFKIELNQKGGKNEI